MKAPNQFTQNLDYESAYYCKVDEINDQIAALEAKLLELHNEKNGFG